MTVAAVPGVGEDIHTTLSPSDATRWLNCGEAIRLDLERNIPDSSGSDADLGTAAHSVFEWCLKRDFASPHQLIGEHIAVKKGVLITVDLEMANAVEIAVDYCRDLYGQLRKGKAKHFSEERVIIPFIAHPADTSKPGGTIDWHAYDDETLHVLDYKNGVGVVEVEWCEQLMLYLCGVLLKLKKPVKRMVLHIVQPRASHPEGPCRTWEPSAKTMDEFRATVEKQVKAIKTNKATYGPTDKGCRWCDHKAICPGLAEKAITQAGQDFKAFISGAGPGPKCDTKGLSSEQLANAMKWTKLVTLWATSVVAEVAARTSSGDPEMLKHYKMVEGQSNRKWKDEEAVKAAFLAAGVSEDKFAPRKLVGIGDGEMLIKAKERPTFMKANAIKPQGNPTLAPVDDPRPAVSKAEQDFKEHITGETK